MLRTLRKDKGVMLKNERKKIKRNRVTSDTSENMLSDE